MDPSFGIVKPLHSRILLTRIVTIVKSTEQGQPRPTINSIFPILFILKGEIGRLQCRVINIIIYVSYWRRYEHRIVVLIYIFLRHAVPESVHDCFSPIRDELLHLLQTFHLLLRRMKRHTTSAASTTPPNVSDTTQGTSSSIRSASTSSSSRFFLRTKSKIKSSLSSRSTAVQKPSSKTSGFSSRVKGVVRLGEDNEKNVHRAEEKLADGPHHPPTQAREPITPASASLGPSSNTLLNRGRLNSMQTNTDTDTSSNRNSLINQIVSVVPHRPMPSAATATTTVAALTMSTKQNTEPETTTIGRTSSLRVIGLVKPRDSRDVLVHSVYQPPSTLVGG